jgi:hypothetical protein
MEYYRGGESKKVSLMGKVANLGVSFLFLKVGEVG